MVTISRMNFGGWANSIQISNGVIDLVVTTDVGPRVIRFGFVGQENELGVFPEMLGKSGEAAWQIRGGHRLWAAPEQAGRTDYPDNSPVGAEVGNDSITILSPTEESTGIQKEISIQMGADSAAVEIRHRIYNRTAWPVELAAWGVTVMAGNGTAILPLPPRGSHAENLLPTGGLALWAYTDLSDSRWKPGRQYLLVRQHANAPNPQKAGVIASQGWAAYARDSHLFVKTFAVQHDRQYPDLGCDLEVYTDHRILEIESLSPLTRLEPGGYVEHREDWRLFSDIPSPGSDQDVERVIMPVIRSILPS
jgi:hypothetical protein